MSRFFLVAVALTAAASLPAQGFSFGTSTDFGVVADDGTTREGDVLASGTRAGARGLQVVARSGSLRSGQSASASTRASAFSAPGVAGLRVQENGSAHGAGSTAGTIAGRPASSRRGPHGLAAAWQVRPNTAGVISVTWESNVRGNANANATVDVDGDGMPDFTGRSGMRDTQRFNVTADANGDVRVAISTAGSATADRMNGALYGRVADGELPPGRNWRWWYELHVHQLRPGMRRQSLRARDPAHADQRCRADRFGCAR